MTEESQKKPFPLPTKLEKSGRLRKALEALDTEWNYRYEPYLSTVQEVVWAWRAFKDGRVE